MKTALEIVNAAIDLEVRGKKHLTFFKFVFDGIEVEYWGCYYGYACHPDGHDEYEFGGDSFDEMLADVIPQTGKSIREMLEALPGNTTTRFQRRIQPRSRIGFTLDDHQQNAPPRARSPVYPE